MRMTSTRSRNALARRTIRVAATVTAAAVIGSLSLWSLSIPSPAAIRIDSTPERLARGRQMFNLGHCDVCHSTRDFSRFNGPVAPGGTGAGLVFPKRLVPVGRVTVPNITPDRDTGIALWTDGEKVRAIREGFHRSGRKLTPVMPYEDFRGMSDLDVYSLVAYLNSLPPVRNQVPPSEFDFRTRMFFRISMLRDNLRGRAGGVPEPDRSDPVKYGAYLVAIGQCRGCHGEDLAGGNELNEAPDAVVVSANITPDVQTGIGSWSEDSFVARFHAYREYLDKGSPVVPPDRQTPMPWLSLCQLDTAELRAIHAFLRSQPPVHRKVAPSNTPNARFAGGAGTSVPERIEP